MRALRRFFRWFLSGNDWFWRWTSSVPVLRTFINWLFIKVIATSAPPRPYPFSLWGPRTADCPAEYTSWSGLTDRAFTGRHLPPAPQDWVDKLPPVGKLEPLFARRVFTPCPVSSALFCFFAQWFTDSFLRTDPADVRKNTSNHEIDLCQVYGLCAGDTDCLRSKRLGKLKSQVIGGEEYPMYLFEADGRFVREEFLGLSYVDREKRDYRNKVVPDEFNTNERRRTFFANGLELGNSTAFYTAINTLFLREHNRLCDEIARQHPGWDDDRIFETARNTNIAQLLKIVVEDYINHISSTAFQLFVDVGSAERQPWYRTNRIAAEFNLLYRWHALVPDQCVVDARPVPDTEFRFDNGFLTTRGVARVVAAASAQRAGKITLRNTASFLLAAELGAAQKSRKWRLRSYNEYRERFGLHRVKSFLEITEDQDAAAALASVYAHVDDVELLTGLLAEGRGKEMVFGDLMTLMVGSDAFSQALTNPLLSSAVFNEHTFSRAGLASILATSTIDQVAQRNASMGGQRALFGAVRTSVPGSYGLPLLGRIPDSVDFFLRSGCSRFFERKRSLHQSDVFKVNLLRPTIAILDRQAMAPLFDSPLLRQDYGFSWAVPPRPLVGDVVPGIFESGPAHDMPKQLAMELLRRRTASLLATFQQVAGGYGDRWTATPGFSFREELENLSAELLFRWYFNMQVAPEQVRTLYLDLFSHVGWRVTRFLPGSAFNRALRIYGGLLAQLKASPGYDELLPVAHRIGMHDPDATAKQLLFLAGMNSFLGLQNFSKSLVGELSHRPALRAQLRAEIHAVLGDAPPQSLRQLGAERMPCLDRVLREVARLHPPVSFIFGRATQDLEIKAGTGQAYPVRKGELLMGVLPLAMRDPALYDKPDDFDPSRFLRPGAGDGLIWPRGRHDAAVAAGDRTCPGKDVAMEIGRLLAVWLLQRFDWELAEPPVWDDTKFSLNVAAPAGDMRVRAFAPRAGG